jgi:glyoxylase-like metal-dependent hydrolase (beta-lactamase superfamily II)
MKIGPYTISTIDAGDFRLDGGAMFGVVPKTLWNRTNPADEFNRIAMTMRSLLIESPDRKILVDTGPGEKDGESFREIYAIDTTHHNLLKSLAEHGLKPDDITDVILTHLHFDHVGGATRIEKGESVPLFEHARHYVQKRQFEHAIKQMERDKASYFPRNYVPLKSAGLLELVDGPGEIIPGIEMILVEGHTPGQQTVRIFDGNGALWFPADLIPMSSHVPLPYIMGYDLFPVTTLEEKKRLLPQAASEQWVVIFEHDPGVPASRLTTNEKGHIVKGENVSV